MSNGSIWPIDRTLSCATNQGQSEPGSDGNRGVLCIFRSSCTSKASTSDCLVSYPGYSLWDSYGRDVVTVSDAAIIIITLHFSSCWVALQPAVLAAARIWPSVSWQLEISYGLRGPPPGGHPQAITYYCLAPAAPLIRGMPTGP